MISEQSWADAQVLWEYHQMHHEWRPCSAAIGLGSHDLSVATVAADAYLAGLVPLIVFTGANSPTTRDRMPRGEALHYKEHAIEKGVPESVILVEPRAANTGQNIEFSRAVLADAGIVVQSILLVSKPYEERRASATARKLWPGIDVVCASAPMSLESYVEYIGNSSLVIDMLVGALQRLMVYPKLGFMAEEVVPPEVVASFERLCAAGFVNRLV
ncbi:MULTISPECIES: YdcF family protein [Streptomyces]|uniref:YdcF family protein n=1 Tax=Streptomyces TaxID=1883 RepID=UPI00099C48FA|nr:MULTISPECIES: YdcF family protein [Streptomyces]MZE79735.1 YdcF family protein [Streptomyces sp. SID5475]